MIYNLQCLLRAQPMQKSLKEGKEIRQREKRSGTIVWMLEMARTLLDAEL